MSSVDLTVTIAGVTLKNPVITASGTCGFGAEYTPYYMPGDIGAVAVKAVTAAPRKGNPTPRIAETASGVINAIGLQNPGADYFAKKELPRLKKMGAGVISNIAGSTADEYIKVVEIIDRTDVDMIELNISCPNVKEGGMSFGSDPKSAEPLTRAVRERTGKPLIVKLSPNVRDITEIAKAAVSGGADALSLINTILAMRIDIRTRRPMLANVTGGLSGPAVFPVALRMVWQTRNAVSVPIIGMGGVTTADDAVEMMLAGADAVAVGTAAFLNPYAVLAIRDGLERYCEENNIAAVRELTGGVVLQ